MFASYEPPIMAVSIGHKRYTHKLISEIGEFVIAFPAEGQEKDSVYVGTHSGRHEDKFSNCTLKILKSKIVKPPIIEGAAACFECKLIGKLEAGDHTIFTGKVLVSYIGKRKRIFNFGEAKLRKI